LIAFYISGHGFGHASRSLELIRALLQKQPGVRIAVKTTAPRWLFEHLADVTYERFEADVGMTQIDSLTIDLAATAANAARFYGDFERRADAEAAWLRTTGVRLVLGDIPPLAHAAAARAGLSSIAIGNFTWDWIYEGYSTFEQHAPGVIQTIRDAYALCTRALRLPMHGGFASMHDVVDIPMIGRRSIADRRSVRDAMNVPDDRLFVLVSFSGGLDIPLERIAADQGLTILSPPAALPPPLEYQDLVSAADVVVSKPGYGIVSECAVNETPLLYTSRGRFPEYDVFVAEMPRMLRCRFIPQDDLRSGRWHPYIDALLAQPSPPEGVRGDGAEAAAELIVRSVRL
jgi:L-arabinokinase